LRKIAIFTTTYYPNGISDWRAQCAVETALKALDVGIPFIIVDSGSPDGLLSIFRNLGATVLPDEKPGQPFGACRRQGLRYLQEHYPDSVAFWMEPEKAMMLDDIDAISKPILTGKAELSTPWRKYLSDSYPIEQAHSESYGNYVFECATGFRWDVFAGPVAIAPNVFSVFLLYNSSGNREDRWDATIIPRIQIAATARGVSVEVNYRHPHRQTLGESGNPEFVKRRLIQLNTLCLQFWEEAERWNLPRK
jgi:hypothetical protein